ncbi:hypothetical protein N7466_005192 [Penicillium verhagenii]|uniref:uncharacterized protein n=1 Tax=Penicillium verhagenii TaxID=1562060 RepID=UPI002545B0D9|nr:uncharacterized protein N7466_005192 [Penicillium verhagenii]KAJ5935645.1 hypothetical protein N7466_005192 [Penicillium verhagenii]
MESNEKRKILHKAIIDSHAQSILAQFGGLSTESRRLVFHGILDQLRRPEWRDVNLRSDRISFEYDILGKLPLEIVALIVEHLPLSDLFLLQTVSRQWRQVLSSPIIQNAAIRATIGSDMSISDSKSVVQKRLRLERGKWFERAELISPLSQDHGGAMRTRGVGYSHGIHAWLSGDSQRGDQRRVGISLLNLWTGRSDTILTENREALIELRISQFIIAALSMRGYCHVWDLQTQEHRSFRLRAIKFDHFVVNGRNVAFSYPTEIVHWGWTAGITRTIPIQTCLVLLALHPSEDQFTAVRLGETVYFGDTMVIAEKEKNCQLYAEKYTIGDTNEFHCSLAKFQFPDYGELFDSYDAQEIFKGQSTIVLKEMGAHDDPRRRLCFSLQDDEVIAHALPPLPAIINFLGVGQDLIYAIMSQHKVFVLEPKYNRPAPLSNVMRECHHSTRREVRHVTDDCQWAFGDADFVILVGDLQMDIWALDETWEIDTWESMGSTDTE